MACLFARGRLAASGCTFRIIRQATYLTLSALLPPVIYLSPPGCTVTSGGVGSAFLVNTSLIREVEEEALIAGAVLTVEKTRSQWSSYRILYILTGLGFVWNMSSYFPLTGVWKAPRSTVCSLSSLCGWIHIIHNIFGILYQVWGLVNKNANNSQFRLTKKMGKRDIQLPVFFFTTLLWDALSKAFCYLLLWDTREFVKCNCRYLGMELGTRTELKGVKVFNISPLSAQGDQNFSLSGTKIKQLCPYTNYL